MTNEAFLNHLSSSIPKTVLIGQSANTPRNDEDVPDRTCD